MKSLFFVLSLSLGMTAATAATERYCVGIRHDALVPGDPMGLSVYFGAYCNDGSSIVRQIPQSRFKEERRKQIETSAVRALSPELREVARIKLQINPGVVRELPVYSERPLARAAAICLLFDRVRSDRSAPLKSLGCTANARLREVIDPLSGTRLPRVRMLEENGFTFDGNAVLPTYYFGKTQRSKFRFFTRH